MKELEYNTWKELEKATLKKNQGFRFGQFATLSEHKFPDLRTVVLRKVKVKEKQLLFHTDIRSGKVAQLEKNPESTWHFYDHNSKVQLIMYCHSEVLKEGDDYEMLWESANKLSLKDYEKKESPGQLISSLDSYSKPEENTDKWVREHFAVIRSKVVQLECLKLRKEGHHRAYWKYDNSGQISESSAIAP